MAKSLREEFLITDDGICELEGLLASSYIMTRTVSLTVVAQRELSNLEWMGELGKLSLLGSPIHKAHTDSPTTTPVEAHRTIIRIIKEPADSVDLTASASHVLLQNRRVRSEY